MGTDGACGLLFCAAKRSGTFPPNMPAGLRARVSRLGGFMRYPTGGSEFDAVPPRLTVLVTIVADRPRAWFPGPLGPYLTCFFLVFLVLFVNDSEYSQSARQ
jgi:hypothetical protein